MYLLSQAISFILQTESVDDGYKDCVIDTEFTCLYPVIDDMMGQQHYTGIQTDKRDTSEGFQLEIGICSHGKESCHLDLRAGSNAHTSFTFHVIPGIDNSVKLAISPGPKQGNIMRAVHAAVSNDGYWTLRTVITKTGNTEGVHPVAFAFSSGYGKSMYLPSKSELRSVLDYQGSVSMRMQILSRGEIILYQFEINTNALELHDEPYILVTPRFLLEHQFKFIKTAPPSPAHFLIQYPDNTNPSLNS